MSTSSTTVLVVDDKQRLRKLVCGYFGHEGFGVLAANGQATLDLMLSGLDGLEV